MNFLFCEIGIWIFDYLVKALIQTCFHLISNIHNRQLFRSNVSGKTFYFSNLIASHHVICTGVNWMKSFSYYPLCHCLASYCATIIIIMITSFWGFPVCLTPWKVIRNFDGKKEGENSSRIYGHLESSYRQLMTQPWSSRF